MSISQGELAGCPRKKLDLTGQRFGKLTRLVPSENIGSRSRVNPHAARPRRRMPPGPISRTLFRKGLGNL